MSGTKSELRQAMRDETEDLSFDMSLSAVRDRARRRALARGGAAVALTVAVVTVAAGPSLVRMASPADPADMRGAASPSHTSTQATARPSLAAATREDPIRTGVALADHRELVLWYATGLVLGGRDATGAVTALPEMSASSVYWVRPHLFDSTFYFADGPSGTVIVVSGINAPVARMTANWAGHTVEVPVARQSEDSVLYWIAGLPQDVREAGRFPELHAYDASGKVLDTIP